VGTFHRGHPKQPKQFIKADAIASLTLARLSAPDVDAWHVRRARRGVGDGSMRIQHLVLRAAVGLAVRWGWLHHNPASAAPLGSRRRPPRGALSESDVRSVLEAAQGLVERSALEPAAVVALRLACVTGARRSELAALRWVDLEGPRLTIDSSIAVIRDRSPDAGRPQLRDDPTKTGNRRVVTLDAATLGALDSPRAHPGMLGQSSLSSRASQGDHSTGVWSEHPVEEPWTDLRLVLTGFLGCQVTTRWTRATWRIVRRLLGNGSRSWL
jgi:integrase